MKIGGRGWGWSRSQFIQAAAIAWLVGLALPRLGWQLPWPVLAAMAAILTGLAWRYRRLLIVPVIGLALLLGWWRGQLLWRNLNQISSLHNQTVTLVGQIEDDPVPTDRAQIEFQIKHLNIVDENGQRPLAGRLRIRGFSGGIKLKRGDVVQVEGRLRPALGNRQGQISFAEIKLLGEHDSLVEDWRRRFFAGVYTALPEPQASLGLGFLVGARSLLPDSLLNQLSATGLTHIVAVSGYNLTIIIRVARRRLATNSKYWSTAISVALIVAFLAFTGFSPSILRAAIVSGLALWAWYYGRTIKPMMLILLAAAITAGINPTYLWYDLGWYLSFLAFFGVMILSPALLARFYQKPKPPALLQLFSETASAQIMTLPIIMYVFNEVSIIAIPANLVVLPLVPLAMLLTLMAGLAGVFIPGLAGWLAWPATTTLSLMVQVIERMASLPLAKIEISLSRPALLLIYLAVVLITVSLQRASRDQRRPSYSVIDWQSSQ